LAREPSPHREPAHDPLSIADKPFNVPSPPKWLAWGAVSSRSQRTLRREILWTKCAINCPPADGEDANPKKCAAHILASGEEFLARKLMKTMHLPIASSPEEAAPIPRHRMAYSGVTEKMVTIVQFRNTHAPVQTKSTTMSITIAPMLLSITSSILPSGTDGTAYSQTLHASGGIPVHT
jgi:hypothetical protein